MWAISKLKRVGLSHQDLKYFYTIKLRTVLESSAVVYHSMLTQEDSSNIERVQKAVVRIIMGPRYISYERALKYLSLEPPYKRREKNMFILCP